MKKIFLLSLMILSMLCASASAHIIYTTQDGKLGLIKVNGTGVNSIDLSGTQYTGSADSVVASYWENNTSNGSGNSKIIFITPKSSDDATISGDTAVRFSSYESLSKPIDDKDKPIYLAQTYGTPIICGTRGGGSLYLATGATMREYRTSDFSFRNSYTYPSLDITAPDPKIKSVIKNDSRIYVLVSLGNDKTVSNASSDVVMELDGTLDKNSEYTRKLYANTSNDAYTMDFISDSRIAVGCEDGVYHVKDSSTTSLVSSDAPVIALHQDTGSGFYYATASSDKNVKLYHYTTSNTKPQAFFTTRTSSDKVKIIKDSTYNVLGVIISDEISIITMSGDSILAEYKSADLGGVPISIAASSTTGNSADTSSGCMIGGAGLALMAALIFALRHKEVD